MSLFYSYGMEGAGFKYPFFYFGVCLVFFLNVKSYSEPAFWYAFLATYTSTQCL